MWAVVVLSRNEAGSEFCVLSSEFETGEKRETSGKGEMGEKGAIRSSKFRVRRSENSKLKTQNPELQIPLVSIFSPVSNSELSTQNSGPASSLESTTTAHKRAAY